jgi:hypothetical protein
MSELQRQVPPYNAHVRARRSTFFAFAAIALVVTSLAHGADDSPAAAANGCSPAAVRAAVRAFAAAYSAGHAGLAANLFAEEPRFEWFSSGPPGRRLGAKAFDRSTLAAYFASRVREHERLRIVQLTGGRFDGRNDAFNFSGKLIRTATDGSSPARPRDFKGAAMCLAGRLRFIVWSM